VDFAGRHTWRMRNPRLARQAACKSQS